MISKRKFLLCWINNTVSKLQDSYYSIATKCFWIINNLQDFPICKICKKNDSFKHKNVQTIFKGYTKACSRACSYKDESRQLKIMSGTFRHFGVLHPLQSEECLQKAQQKCLQQFGAKCVFSKESTLNVFENISKKLGKIITNASQIPGVTKKVKVSKFVRYNDENYTNSEQAKQTTFKHFGVSCFLQSKEVKNILVELYGVDNPWKNKDIQNKCKKRYTYDNKGFDSSLEIAYYIWLQNANKKFTYQPDQCLSYEFDGNQFKYHPDFLVDRQLIEIKGKYFFDITGKMICPYRNKEWTDDQYDYVCMIYEAKHQCMLQNNVKIVLSDSAEMKEVLQYIDAKYGKNYIKQFKNY